MKKYALAVLVLLLSAWVALAATYTRSSARVISFVGMPAYDAGGNITSVNIHAGVVQLLVNDGDSTDIRGRDNLISVDFDALSAGIASSNITAAGKTVTYTQWAALTRQMVLDRASAGGITQNGASKINAGALAQNAVNSPFYWFLGITVTLLGGIGYFLRGALFFISTIAAQHAKIYAVAYVKGGALIAIAAGGAFGTGYQALTPAIQATMPWAPYVIFFWLPISAGLAVLVAFLDRSAQTATKDAQAVGLLPPAPPVAPPAPFTPAPQPPSPTP